MSCLVGKANVFARERHAGQKRKYTGVPYFEHCVEVLNIYKHFYPKGGATAKCAALLHDTVEDTYTNHQEIYDEFGEEVFELVFYLTDISKAGDGNRAMRKAIDRMHLVSSYDKQVYCVKCADLISNTKNIKEYDAGFAKTYLPEKKLMLDAMAEAIPEMRDEKIWQTAYGICERIIDVLV